MNGWTNIWQILGISYTTDINEIKQAYASRAKECHPEEHPEEFNRLQKAYKSAVQIAKNRKAYEKAREETEKKAAEREAGESTGESMPEVPAKQTVEIAEEVVEEPSEQTAEPVRAVGEEPFEQIEEPVKAANEEFSDQTEELVKEIWAQSTGIKEETAWGIEEESVGETETPSDFSFSFDYSEIQDRESLKKQQAKADARKRIMYIIWNPYARNNVKLWECFLSEQGQGELFLDLEFRLEFVRLLYQERFAGWHRSQILFFREYLRGFQEPEQPAPELQLREWNWLLENSGTGSELLESPCITEEEEKYYKNIDIRNKSVLVVLQDDPDKPREGQYLDWYMGYAEKNEDRLQTAYREWVELRKSRFEHSDPLSIQWRVLYMIWNPYVRNNITMWKCFLNGKRTRELFGDPGFRLMFARQICNARFAGWQKDQISFFWQFLEDFEPNGKLSGDFPAEEWNQLFHSAQRGSGARLLSRLTSKEKAAYDDLYTREIFAGVEPDPVKRSEEQYLDWYWRYAEQNEERLAAIYKKWSTIRKRLLFCKGILVALPIVAAVILVFLWEIHYYKPYENDLRRYQKMFEELQESSEVYERLDWNEFQQQIQDESLEIQRQYKQQ